MRVVALDLLLELNQVLQLQLVLLETRTHLPRLLRLLLRLLLQLAVESGQLWDFLGFLPDRLEEFPAVESHCPCCHGLLLLLVRTVGEVLDPKAVFLGCGIEVGSGIHGLFGVADGWAVVEVVGLPEGLLGELFLGCLFGEGVVLVLY